MSSRKFILESTELGRVELEDDPIGWDATKKVFTRNLKYIGVFRKRTATLKFIGDGLDYCVELEALSGTEAVLNVTIMQKKDYEDAWELEFQGIGKFNPFDIEWGDDLNPELSIEFEDSGFHNRFLTRAGMEVNIGDTLSIEGVDIGAMPTKQIQVAQRTIQENNTFTIGENVSYYGGVIPPLPPEFIQSEDGHVLPIEKVEGDTDFVQTPTDYLLATPGLAVDFVTQPTALTFVYDIEGSGNARLSALSTVPDFVQWVIRVFTDSSDLTIFTDYLLHQITGLSISDPSPFSFDFDGTININLGVGHAATFICWFEKDLGGIDQPGYDVTYTKTDVGISLIQNFDEYVSNCHYRYEFTQRLVQIITDQVDCFKSDAFGRMELGYAANGLWWNNVCYNGNQLRGFTEKFPVRSFDKSFQSARAIWNIGCGIEKINGRFKVVFEDLPYFFRGDISITLHNVRKVKRQNNEQFTFSELNVGYEKAEYEQANGLEEYNNKSKFATFIKSDSNVLDLISPDRADGYGKEYARRKNKLIAATEDTPYDNEIFTEMVDEDGSLLRSQQDGNYDSVLNIQSPETAPNLDITPQRNLIRNGDWISGCVYKYPDELLKFISSDKATDLSTTRTGDADAVVEQTSILNSDLKSSLWINKNHVFESDITPAQVAAMELKPFSLIKWSPFSRCSTKKYYYGWILEVTAGGKERSGNFVLLAANTTSDRLVIVDPEGLCQEEEGTPMPPGPPGETEFGFEYGFEKVFES